MWLEYKAMGKLITFAINFNIIEIIDFVLIIQMRP